MGSEKRFIEKFTIQNFKGFETLELEQLCHFNLFVGSNNIGKTSVLEALAMAHSFYPAVGFFQNFLKKLREVRLETIAEHLMFFHNYDDAKNIRLETFVKDIEGMALSVKYIRDGGTADSIDCQLEPPQLHWNVRRTEVLAHRESTKLTNPVIQTLEATLAEYQTEIIAEFHKGNVKEYQKFRERTFPRARSLYRGFRLSSEESELIRSRSFKGKVLEFAQKIDPYIEDLTVDERRALFYYPNIDKPLPMNHLGVGFAKVLKLYLAILLDDVDVILFDEITDSLHPETIQVLLDKIVPELKARDIQLFATTHSHDILSIIAKQDSVYQDNIAVYNLYQDKHIHAFRYDCDGVARFLEEVRS